MTRDQITRLAKEAGIRDCTCDGDFGCIERFAALVAEREWVGLNRMELIKCGVLPFGNSYALYEAIEAKLKEKNT